MVGRIENRPAALVRGARDMPQAAAKLLAAIQVQRNWKGWFRRPCRSRHESLLARTHLQLWALSYRQARRAVRHRTSSFRRPRATGRRNASIFVSLVRFALRYSSDGTQP